MRSLSLIGLVLLATPSAAQEVKDSTVSGTLVSRSVTIPAGETAGELLLVPSGTTFIMTQACASSPYNGSIIVLPRPIGYLSVSVIGSQLGVVPLITCDPFHPGIAFGADEHISCQLSFTTSVDVSCLVTGVLQPDRSRGRTPWSH